MNQIRFNLLLLALILTACTSKQVELEERFGYQLVNSGEHRLATKTFGKGNVTVILEAGLNTQCKTWIDSGLVTGLENYVKVIIYSRPGIYPSDNSEHPANIENMIKDLDALINTLAKGDKLILVGHSLGGAIIRAYSINHPEKVVGLVFIDTTHEIALDSGTQEEVKEHLSELGVPETNPYYKEMIEMKNTLEYISNIGNLPDIPVIALSALGSDEEPFDEGRRLFNESHKTLGTGISDFTHIEVPESGHAIQFDQPEAVLSAIREIYNKIQ